MESFAWEDVKEFYKVHFGISNWVVEMFANMDILVLCASGASNETISTFLEISVDEIQLVIKEVFGFSGWNRDLPINPYKLYQDCGETLDESIFNDLLPYLDIDVEPFDLLYVCGTMKEIEERIYDEWV